jgi:hypothetical protein
MAYVIAAVSASSGSPQALIAAAAEAQARGAELIALQAWRPPRPPAAPRGRPPSVSRDPDAEFAAAERALRAHVSAILGTGAAVTCRVVRGAPSSVLLAESAGADLLVLDAPRTRESMRSPVLAHRLIYAASCPILILPPTAPPAGA